jgi:hypothetical protein
MDTDFLAKKDNKPHLKFHVKKGVLRIYQFIGGYCVSVDELPTLGLLESVAVFGLNGVLSKEYNTGYTSILVAFNRYTFHRVSCEIRRWVIYLGLEREGNSVQNSRVGNRTGSKKIKCFQTPPAHFLWSRLGDDLAHLCMSEFPRRLEHIKRVKSRRWFQVGFY